eukprot:CAMPEP_0114115668 /NCGR_PEP_ID=MMETSP0043_2-20121206/4090_1 /TAXON_ID=464988 /ORGANISM="Hemiselmis andersenii, Strain CCMP644" /LENGTH=252 /DNA_ID=CAMNT_0001207943 /DNA_START=826 /DNA_END=1581 /DNA_ORIENTATION=-
MALLVNPMVLLVRSVRLGQAELQHVAWIVGRVPKAGRVVLASVLCPALDHPLEPIPRVQRHAFAVLGTLGVQVLVIPLVCLPARRGEGREALVLHESLVPHEKKGLAGHRVAEEAWTISKPVTLSPRQSSPPSSLQSSSSDSSPAVPPDPLEALIEFSATREFPLLFVFGAPAGALAEHPNSERDSHPVGHFDAASKDSKEACLHSLRAARLSVCDAKLDAPPPPEEPHRGINEVVQMVPLAMHVGERRRVE